MATAAGTWSYRDRFGDRFGRTYFRRFGRGVVSSVGLGTYLGEPTDAVDSRYCETIRSALDAGVNLVDTAINYRCQRSERVIGDAVRESAAEREEVVVTTKGGFVPFDGERPDDPGAYVREEFVEPGLVDPGDLARGSHSIAPAFLEELLDRSLSNLGLETVDCYYVHNPETQLSVRDREAVYEQLGDAFRALERRRAAGEVGRYGVASWEAFRVGREHESFLDLGRVLKLAASATETVGVDSHGLRAIQLPFNVGMADAFNVASHTHGDERVSALEFANREGLGVFASASLGQGALAGGLPPEIAAELAGETSAQRALNFARSAPAVTGALVGMSTVEHVRENVAAGTFDPMGASAFDAIFE
ncbi:aldo/keto reductase [Halorarum halobium]|uniref:aldo/keto reductase n=1 Tax=Halorarum halobium TaxID=3075121 RepID=UPI0028A9DE85|nr:aldo/keto reductase [Halobaculum sp. XH14]